jgi:hypothetical protein
VIAVDESAVLVQVPRFDEERAVGLIKAEALGGNTGRYRAGNMARVEVVGVRQLRNGRTIVELRPAPRNAGRA